MTDRIQILKPNDFHMHLRQEEVLIHTAPWAAHWFHYVLAMPNLIPPIRDAHDASDYAFHIFEVVHDHMKASRVEPRIDRTRFETLTSVMLTPETTAKMLSSTNHRVTAVKLYPRGATTNSDHGISISEIARKHELFDFMQEHGFVLCIHAEDPDAPVLQREQRFLPIVYELVRAFPRLKIVIEHVSTAEGVAFVLDMPVTVGATITAHHLLLTLDDLLGSTLDPHSFCKPVVKTEADRQKLLEAAFAGHPKFFFGSDSAPHRTEQKQQKGSAGIFSAPTAVPLMLDLFHRSGVLEMFDRFMSTNGADFYDLPHNEEYLTFERKELPPGTYRVPGYEVLQADLPLPWSLLTT
ncbi:dihydroorotase [Candidatus Uhrbacteria bacterium]|nr:dihydroorotase [Candidatus Uhrbacteria bacterium]MBD3284467.1 dihydroorotase [Candidatus Uhrbacteria bacterium]